MWTHLSKVTVTHLDIPDVYTLVKGDNDLPGHSRCGHLSKVTMTDLDIPDVDTCQR